MSNKKEIDYSLVTQGPLQVDPKYIEPGYHYMWPTNRPGEIDYYKRLGYEIVQDLSGDVKSGLDKPNTSSAFGTAVTVQSKCGATHILMKITDDLYNKFEAFKAEKNRQVRASLGHVDGIPSENQYGSITIDKNKL